MCIAFTLKLTAVRVTCRKLHKINPRSVNTPADTVTGVKELREGERGEEEEGEQEMKVGTRCVRRCGG